MSRQVLEKFYEAFSDGDAETMGAQYHPEATFEDPAFGKLSCKEAKAMWEMLIKRSKGDLKIEYHSVVSDSSLAQCIWEAHYTFGKTGRPVHNIIHTSMQFKDGLIINHVDHFNFWRWSSMALGTPGKLLGWTPFLKMKVRKTVRSLLNKHLAS